MSTTRLGSDPGTGLHSARDVGERSSSAVGVRWWEAFGLLALALAVRLLPWRSVFLPEGVQYPGNDPYYHARRVLYGSVQLPDVLTRDPYLSFPGGGEPIWSPTLDVLGAALVRALGAAGDAARIDGILAVVPPVLGALTVVATAWLGARWLGRATGLGAGALLALLPAHAGYSQVGFFDHHVAVALAAVAGLAAAMAWLDAAQAGRSLVGGTAALGLALAGSLLVWPGMLLHVGVLEAAGVVFVATRRRADAQRRAAFSLAAAHALAFACVAPFGLGRSWALWGAFTPVVLSAFQPWLLGAGGVAHAAVGLAAGSGERALPAARRWLSVMAVGVGVLALSAAAGGLFFGSGGGLLADPFAQVWAWFAKSEAFQAEVAESRPMWRQGGAGWWMSLQSLSGLLLALPFALAAAARQWRPRAAREGWAPGLLLAGWTAALLAASLVQLRFANSLSIGLALVVAWWLPRAAAAIAPHRARGTLVAAVVVLALLPVAPRYAPQLRNLARGLSGEEPLLQALDQRRRMLAEAARWIAENTPETSGWLDAETQPEYGLLAAWTDGHVLGYLGRRPTVLSPFGDDVGGEQWAAAQAYYRLPEPEASALLDRLGVRYVLHEFRRTRALSELPADSTTARLYFHDGEAGDQSVASDRGPMRVVPVEVDAAERHRLVWESPPKPWAKRTRPGFKLYEHVAGARLEGRAVPGAEVRASLDLESNRGRAFRYAARTRADAEGRYRLRVPHATRHGPASVRSRGPYRIESGGRSVLVEVDEADVTGGRAVAIPDLAAPGADAGSDRARASDAGGASPPPPDPRP